MNGIEAQLLLADSKNKTVKTLTARLDRLIYDVDEFLAKNSMIRNYGIEATILLLGREFKHNDRDRKLVLDFEIRLGNIAWNFQQLKPYLKLN